MTEKKNRYSKKDHTKPDEFEPEKVRVRISMMIPGDILQYYKRLADDLRRPYQTLMQEDLRQAMEASSEDEEPYEPLSKVQLDQVKDVFLKMATTASKKHSKA